MRSRSIVLGLIVLAAASRLVGGLADPGHAQAPPKAPGQPQPFPQGQPLPPLPPGHPPMGTPAPGMPPGAAPGLAPSVVAPPPGSGTGAAALTWTAPAGWTKEQPSSTMRKAQYRIPGAGGAGECIVYYFGPGQGGDPKSNAMRWAAQFRRADGKPVSDPRTREFKVGDVKVVAVEVTGTYVGGMGGTPAGPERPNHMLLGAIAEGPDANWFFRAIGPRKTIEAQRGAFDQMVKSIKKGKS